VIVVCNTSPITNLAAIGHLSLLQQLYIIILIPEAVFRELVNVSSPVPGTQEVQTLGWIQTQSVVDRELVISLEQELDPGEAEAIALALELHADLLLLDERRGYRVASRLNLRVQGVLGVLLAAKFRGLISSVKPILDEMIDRAGFWVSQNVYTRFLEQAGETTH